MDYKKHLMCWADLMSGNSVIIVVNSYSRINAIQISNPHSAAFPNYNGDDSVVGNCQSWLTRTRSVGLTLILAPSFLSVLLFLSKYTWINGNNTCSVGARTQTERDRKDTSHSNCKRSEYADSLQGLKHHFPHIGDFEPPPPPPPPPPSPPPNEVVGDLDTDIDDEE